MSVLDHDVDRTARASSAAPLPGFSNWADSFPDDEVWTLDLDADVRAVYLLDSRSLLATL